MAVGKQPDLHLSLRQEKDGSFGPMAARQGQPAPHAATNHTNPGRWARNR
uniref:Uncharacterized protein n=1 Tax=Triticum urartu TaxID=4572 RepID=A0A8R7TSF7_TRIUA